MKFNAKIIYQDQGDVVERILKNQPMGVISDRLQSIAASFTVHSFNVTPVMLEPAEFTRYTKRSPF